MTLLTLISITLHIGTIQVWNFEAMEPRVLGYPEGQGPQRVKDLSIKNRSKHSNNKLLSLVRFFMNQSLKLT